MNHIKGVNEFYGGGGEEFKHKAEDLNMPAVMEGLNLIRHYRPEDYFKFFGDRIFKSYKPVPAKDPFLNQWGGHVGPDGTDK